MSFSLMMKERYVPLLFQGGDVRKRCEARFRTGVVTGFGRSNWAFR